MWNGARGEKSCDWMKSDILPSSHVVDTIHDQIGVSASHCDNLFCATKMVRNLLKLCTHGSRALWTHLWSSSFAFVAWLLPGGIRPSMVLSPGSSRFHRTRSTDGIPFVSGLLCQSRPTRNSTTSDVSTTDVIFQAGGQSSAVGKMLAPADPMQKLCHSEKPCQRIKSAKPYKSQMFVLPGFIKSNLLSENQRVALGVETSTT